MSEVFRRPGLRRTRLVDLVDRTDGLVVIEAGFGSGKSFLADQLRGSGDREVIDDVDGRPWYRPFDDAILLSRLPIANLNEHSTALKLTEIDLWFDEDEILELLERRVGHHPAHPAVAAAIHTTTGGWPAAVGVLMQLLAFQPRARRQIDRLSLRGPHYSSLFAQITSRIPDAFLDTIGELANLPILIPSFLDRLEAAGESDRARMLGLPIRFEPDGCGRLPEPLRLHLADRVDLDSSVAVECGVQLVEVLGLDETLGVLMDAQCWEAAQEVLLATPEPVRFRSSHYELLHRLRHLVARVEGHPETMLTIAGLSFRLGRFEEAERDLERCVRAARLETGDRIELRADIMRAIITARTQPDRLCAGVVDALRQRQDQIGDHVSALEFEELCFVSTANHLDTTSLLLAAELGEDLAYKLAAAGQQEAGAEILRQVAVGPLLALGRYRQMAALDSKANDMAGDVLPGERHLVVQALALALAGDLRGHTDAVNRLEQLHGGLSAGWLEAYLWGARMIASSISGSADGVGYAFGKYEESIGELTDTPSGQQWLALAATAFAIVDDGEAAAGALRRALAVSDAYLPDVGMAELTVTARFGKPAEAASVFRRLRDAELISPERRWRAELELMIADRRLNRTSGGDLDALLEAASTFGMSGLALELARPLLDRSNSDARPYEVQLFGEFSIESPSGPVDVSRGKPAELIKLLALRDGTVHVETVIDSLWPELDPAVGRRRLKNVLNRARALLDSDCIVRRGDSIVLSGEVDSDLRRYRRAVATAAAAPPDSSSFVEASVSALEIARRGLLPDDAFAEWAADDRWDVDSTAGRLLSELAALTVERVDPDWLMDVGDDLGTSDEDLYLTVAHEAELAGLWGPARRARNNAKRVAAELA